MAEIDFDIDVDELLEYAAQRLGKLADKAPSIVARGINKSTKDIEKILWETARKTYAVKISGIRKNFDVKKANKNQLYAIMRTKSSALPLRKFNVRAGVKMGVRPQKGDPLTRAKVYKENKLRQLDGGHEARGPAFITRFKSGHEAVVQRIKGEYMRGTSMKRKSSVIENMKSHYSRNGVLSKRKAKLISRSVRVGGAPRELMNGRKTKGREQIVELKTIGIVGMVGNDLKHGISEKKVEAILETNIMKEIDKELRKL